MEAGSESSMYASTFSKQLHIIRTAMLGPEHHGDWMPTVGAKSRRCRVIPGYDEDIRIET
jgi:hypothetical protein